MLDNSMNIDSMNENGCKRLCFILMSSIVFTCVFIHTSEFEGLIQKERKKERKKEREREREREREKGVMLAMNE